MIKRITLLGSALALLGLATSLPAAADTDPEQVAAEYNAALASSEADNQGFEATNVELAGNVTCSITPYDTQNATFRSHGFGSPQAIVENVTVKGEDHADFQAECHSPDADAFSMTLLYRFEYQAGSGIWQAASEDFTCSTDNTGVGRVRVATKLVPGNTDCVFKHFYPENHVSLGRSHRLYVLLTTTADNYLQGVSKPWPMYCATGSDCRLIGD